MSQHTALFTQTCWFKKTLGDEMKKVMHDVTKMVNFTKQRPVHSRIFKKLCKHLDKQHINILSHI
jgi:hypothetical protein